MKTQKCFYNQPTCVSGRTREHVISASVLKAVFGDPIKNVVWGKYLGEKKLYNHEQVIRDVCAKCNNEALSPYDTAGVSLIKQLLTHNPTGVRLSLSREIIGWLVKTHLNHIRFINDENSGEIYPIEQRIKSALILQNELPHTLFKLLIEGWEGEPFYWDAEDVRHISWFNYRSVRFQSQRIVISDFRIKTLNTWLIIPSDADYDNFDERVNSALSEAFRDFGLQLQPVNIFQALSDGYIDIKQVQPLNEVKKFIVKKHRWEYSNP